MTTKPRGNAKYKQRNYKKKTNNYTVDSRNVNTAVKNYRSQYAIFFSRAIIFRQQRRRRGDDGKTAGTSDGRRTNGGARVPTDQLRFMRNKDRTIRNGGRVVVVEGLKKRSPVGRWWR